MQTMSSDEARRGFRQLLDAAMRGDHSEITRYGEPIAVVVPWDWYQAAAGGQAEPAAEAKL
jgi:prevent-host-death family protein